LAQGTLGPHPWITANPSERDWGHPLAGRRNSLSELVEPEVEAAIVRLRGEHLVAPVRLAEGRIRHVRRRSHVRRTIRFWPARSLRRPVAVREVVVGVVEMPVDVVLLGLC